MKAGKSGPFTEHRLLPNGERELVKVHESLEAATEALVAETKKMPIANAYLPFRGSSIHGFGEIRHKQDGEFGSGKFVFQSNDGGRIYFNSFGDSQVRGILIVEVPYDGLLE